LVLVGTVTEGTRVVVVDGIVVVAMNCVGIERCTEKRVSNNFSG